MIIIRKYDKNKQKGFDETLKNSRAKKMYIPFAVLITTAVFFWLGYYITSSYKNTIVSSYNNIMETAENYYHDFEDKVRDELNIILPGNK